MRTIALLATYNEERFIDACLQNLIRQGLQVYLIDNDSSDRTVAIAERYLARGLIGIETLARAGTYSWRPILERKEQLAATLEGAWFIHVDADEIRLPPKSWPTLSQFITAADQAGYNAVNFIEYTFVPTIESPDHDHADFQQTMRYYYSFQPFHPYRLNAWKRQAERVDLASSGGHKVSFPNLRMHPESCPMRHYLFLSLEHAQRKYIQRSYDPKELASGWHRARASLQESQLKLQPQSELRVYISDDQLDPAHPYTKHPIFKKPLSD